MVASWRVKSTRSVSETFRTSRGDFARRPSAGSRRDVSRPRVISVLMALSSLEGLTRPEAVLPRRCRGLIGVSHGEANLALD